MISYAATMCLTRTYIDQHISLTANTICGCCCCCNGAAGTPLQNSMVELYGLLSFMYPDVFTTPGPFEAAFNLVKGQVRRPFQTSQLIDDSVIAWKCQQRPVGEVYFTMDVRMHARG